MKWQAAMVLIAIAVGITLPPSLPLILDRTSQPAIGTLDICHPAAPALSSNGDMPGMNEPVCSFFPEMKINTISAGYSFSKPFIIAFRDERPPKA